MGRTITVASQKGGVGKTTTAVNLAATLCLSGRNVLLIDLDPQANASSGVGFHRSSPLFNSRSTNKKGVLLSVSHGDGFEPFITETSVANLSLIPSTPELSDLEVIRRIQSAPVAGLRHQVESISGKYDYTLIDCPPSLGGIPTIALSLSESVLVPIQCEYYAMEGLSQILPVIEELQRTTNPRLQVLGLLLTMFSSDLQLSNDVADEVRRYFRDAVFETVIPRDVVLAEAASHGVPVFNYDIKSRGAWSYVELAREVLAHGHA